MTRRFRKILLYISLVVFIGAAGPVVLYTLGYRVDWQTLALQKTGGIFIVVEPPGAQVFLDDHFYRETPFLNRGLLIQHVQPGTHTIRVEEEGYWPWTKEFAVAPEEVFEAEVLLVPRSPADEIRERGSFESMWPSPAGDTLLLTERVSGNRLNLRVYDAASQTFLSSGDPNTEKRVSNIGSAPTALSWDTIGQRFTAATAGDWVEGHTTREGIFTIKSLYQESTLKNILKKKPNHILLHPTEPNTYYVLSNTDLYIWKQGISLETPTLDTVSAMAIRDDQRLILLHSQSGILYATDADTSSSQAVSTAAIPALARSAHPEIQSAGNLYVVSTDIGSWVVSPDRSEPISVSPKRIQLHYDQETQKLIMWEGRTAIVWWLRDEARLPNFLEDFDTHGISFKTPGEILSLFSYPEEDYLVGSLDTGVYIIELDPRGRERNIHLLYPGDMLPLWVSYDTNTAVILKDGNLVEIELGESDGMSGSLLKLLPA